MADHPQMHTVHVHCSGCGHKFDVRSACSQDELPVQLCNRCHSAYTGKRKVVTTGRVEQFAQRYAKLASGSKKVKS